MDKQVIETVTGDILIGYVVEPPDDFKKEFESQYGVPFSMFGDGIWLKRDSHVTYLDKNQIVSMRKASIFDREKRG